MKQFITLSALLLFIANAFAQQILGVVKDKNGTAIPYVNIGIAKRNLGVISNENGMFSFNITTEKSTDTVQISVIGYQTQLFTLAQLQERCASNTPIYLTINVYQLAAVTIKPNDYETKAVGNGNVDKLNCSQIDELMAKNMDTSDQRKYKQECVKRGMNPKAFGFELGNKIKIKKGMQTFVDNIQFKTCLGAKDTAIYRINVYGNETTIKRKFTVIGNVRVVALTNLLKQPIIIKTIGKTEVNNLNITNQNIEVDDDFIIGIECIYSSNYKINIGSKLNVFGSTDFLFRPSPSKKWVDIPLVDLTLVSASITQKKAKPFYKFW